MGSACASEDKKNEQVEQVQPESPADAPKEETPAEPEKPAEPKYILTLVGAKGFRDSAWMPGIGKPDCYMEVKKGEETLFSTKAISNIPEPVWNESFETNDINDGDNITFVLLEKEADASSGDVIAQATVSETTFREGFNGEVKLSGEQTLMKLLVKPAEKEVPPGPPTSFTMSVEKTSKDQSFGLDLDTQDEKVLYVLQVKPGPFLDYNNTAKPEVQLTTSGVIVSVNGKSASIEQMLEQFRGEMKVECQVKKSVLCSLVFERGDLSTPHGLVVPEKPQGDFLLVKGVSEGAAEAHNANAGPHDRLYPGDRIVCVGNFRGMATKLLEQLDNKSGKVHIIIMRAAEGGANGDVVHWLF